jgi:arylsulfatase A-like enzyme
MTKGPNILWICTDQQRLDTLGCYGNSFVRTPVLDSLAGESALFEKAFCQSPACTPSRGSFLTGRYPVTSRTRQNGTDIPSSEILVTKLFHDAGYYCGLSGKLHLSACNPASGCTEMERRIDDGYDEFHWSHDTAALWGLITNTTAGFPKNITPRIKPKILRKPGGSSGVCPPNGTKAIGARKR